MLNLLTRCVTNAKNYHLKRWVKRVAEINNTSLEELGLDPRDNECLKEYLMNNPEIAKHVID